MDGADHPVRERTEWAALILAPSFATEWGLSRPHAAIRAPLEAMMTDELPRPTIWVIIPPPIWALLLVLAAWRGGDALGLEPFFRHAAAGWTIFAAGFAVAASGRLAFARAGTEVVPVSRKNTHLVASGPFSITRNPMYLGILIGLIGLAAVIGTIAGALAPIIFFLFVNYVSIPYEERKMEAQFGEEYRAYKARVRRWI